MSYTITALTDDEYGDDSVARLLFANHNTGATFTLDVPENGDEYSAFSVALDALFDLAVQQGRLKTGT